MANSEYISIVLGRVGNFVERGNTIIAGELEDMRRVLNDADVNVTTFQRVDTCTRVD